MKDLRGKVFGRLEVLEFAYKNERGESYWKCKCSCEGNEPKEIKGKYLISGEVKSCGCIRKEHAKEIGKKVFNESKRIQKLPRNLPYKNKLRNVWNNFKHRCNNPNDNHYKWYGANGIRVCNEWLGENGFFNFYSWAMESGYCEGLQLDRVNNKGNYEPSNCEWTNRIIQCNNTNNTRTITIRKKTQTLRDWSKETGIPVNVLKYRVDRGIQGIKLLEEYEPPFTKKEITISLPAKEWAEVVGITSQKFKKRYEKGIRGKELIAKER